MARSRLLKAPSPKTTAPGPYDYFVAGANGMPGMRFEIDKRAREGWELIEAYQETSGGFFGFFGRRHVLIFRRPMVVESFIACSECGAEIDEDSLSCGNCGAQFD